MNHKRVARLLITLGSIILLASAALHSLASYSKAFPALGASNLSPGLQAAFRVIFLSVGWHWLVIAVVVLTAAARRIKLLVLWCGLAVLVETIAGVAMMGLFIGNEMIGAAAILVVCGGMLSEAAQN